VNDRREYHRFLANGSTPQLRQALGLVDRQLDVAYADELTELRWMRRQLLEELDARGVAEVKSELLRLVSRRTRRAGR
jgi:hypothetical protein